MSNKRNAALTTAAFYAVLLFCLVGVGAGAYLLLFPDTPESPGTDQPQQGGISTSDVEKPPAEVLYPVTLPQTDPGTESVPADSPGEEAEPVDIPTEEPAEQEPESSVPVVAVPTPEAPKPTQPVTAVAPNPVVSPLEGEIVAAFSMDSLIYNETLEDWRTHDGIDISSPAGTDVLSAAAGVVADIREDDFLGTTVVLQHDDGYRTVYASLEPEVAVSFGEKVSSGQRLGKVGVSAGSESAAGPHLHFSVTKDGKAVDPAEYLK